MVRLADLPEWERAHMLAKVSDLTGFESRPWVRGGPLADRRVAIVTTAGVHRASDRPFAPGDRAIDYRILPGDVPARELVLSHLSTNFDRTGFQQDLNVVFPIDRLRELAGEGVIGSVAEFHYSFMGAAPIRKLEPRARQLAALLRGDQVDAVVFSPV